MKKNIFRSILVLGLLPGAAAAQVQVVSKTPYGPIVDMNAALNPLRSAR